MTDNIIFGPLDIEKTVLINIVIVGKGGGGVTIFGINVLHQGLYVFLVYRNCL